MRKSFSRIAMVLMAAFTFGYAEEAASPAITWFGMAQYRLRLDLVSQTDSPDVKSGSSNYSNMIGYKFGAKVKANEEVNFLIELGNLWNTTETVNDAALAGFTPFFSAAQAEWNPGAFHVSGGLLKIKNSTLLDLFAASVYGVKSLIDPLPAPGSYHFSSWATWSLRTSSGLPGLKIGAPILQGDVDLGLDITTSIISERVPLISADSSYKHNNSAVLFLLDVPITMGDLTCMPQAYTILNRYYRDDGIRKKASDTELGFGVDAAYKANDMISARAGFAYAMSSNENVTDTFAVTNDTSAESGLQLGVGTSIKAGPGKADVDFILSISEEKPSTYGSVTAPFFDLKYAVEVSPKFTITPRLRIFMISNKHEDSASIVRPELIFAGNF